MDPVSLIHQLQKIAVQPGRHELRQHLSVVTDTLLCLLDHPDAGVSRMAAATIELFTRNYKDDLHSNSKLIERLTEARDASEDASIRSKCQIALQSLVPDANEAAPLQIDGESSSRSSATPSVIRKLYPVLVELPPDFHLEDDLTALQARIVTVCGVISVTQTSDEGNLYLVVNLRRPPNEIARKQVTLALSACKCNGKVIFPEEQNICMKSNSSSVEPDEYLKEEENTPAVAAAASPKKLNSFNFFSSSTGLFADSKVLGVSDAIVPNAEDEEMRQRLRMKKANKTQNEPSMSKFFGKLTKFVA
eukprot:GHVL01014539.1.p1 GENE.GHVL01014539.1~~GHVL01014539.1.p1  ORF type:complete len:305 (-),score=68.59 GHVL01014539.1:100-1014(-)